MKISICGTGKTATAVGLCLVHRHFTDELLLVSRSPEGVAAGHALDLGHASVFLSKRPMRVRSGNVDDAAGSDVIIITNSVSMEGVTSRMDLADGNAAIFAELIPKLAKDSPGAVFVIVTNPVDVMTYLAMKLAAEAAGVDPARIIGTGTLIDTSRFRALLADHVRVQPVDVRAYVLGEHGESMVPLLSVATVAGVKLPESVAQIKDIFQTARRGGWAVMNLKGHTDYGIAACTTMIVAAVALNTREVFPVSTLATGQYGIEDVVLSLPCILGRGGVEGVLQPSLTGEEEDAMRASGEVIRAVTQRAMAAAG